MNLLSRDNELLTATIDALGALDTYLMADWDEHAKKRVRARFALVAELLREEQEQRAKAGTAA